jgi:hypothetical protein
MTVENQVRQTFFSSKQSEKTGWNEERIAVKGAMNDTNLPLHVMSEAMALYHCSLALPWSARKAFLVAYSYNTPHLTPEATKWATKWWAWVSMGTNDTESGEDTVSHTCVYWCC